MRTLPQLPNSIQPREAQLLQLKGINASDNYTDGSFSDCMNISSRKYPRIATRRGRTKLTQYSGATALTSIGKMVVVQGTDLYYDGEVVGQVTEGKKQFAIVNTKLVIWPDKVYLDTTDNKIKSLAATSSGSGATFTAEKITVTWDIDFTTLFKAGDVLDISGCETTTANNKTVAISGVEAKVLTIDSTKSDTYKPVEGTETSTITIQRKIPDLDYICESENRLWGCCNEDRTVYASALGDPTNFYDYTGESTDAYAVAVGSQGEFTGCCALSSSVLFFKGATLHKILGSYPSEYVLYTYTMEGVRQNCHKSLKVINESLLYMSGSGVFAYSGGTTSIISAALGDKEYTNAVAGADGDYYYLSCQDINEVWHFFMYDTKNGLWLEQDHIQIIDFVRIENDMYFLTSDGDIYMADNLTEDNAIEWSMTFNPFQETISGSYNSTKSIFGKKKYKNLFIRCEIPKGGYAVVEGREDGGMWKEYGKILGKETGVQTFVLPPMRCEKFELKLSGKGQITIHHISRQYSVGSEV